MTRTPSNHQTRSKVSDAPREPCESTSNDATEPVKLIDTIPDTAPTVPRHRLLGPTTATPRRWVNDTRPANKRPT